METICCFFHLGVVGHAIEKVGKCDESSLRQYSCESGCYAVLAAEVDMFDVNGEHLWWVGMTCPKLVSGR